MKNNKKVKVFFLEYTHKAKKKKMAQSRGGCFRRQEFGGLMGTINSDVASNGDLVLGKLMYFSSSLEVGLRKNMVD